MNEEERISQIYDMFESGVSVEEITKYFEKQTNEAFEKLSKVKEYIEKAWLADKDSGEILIDLKNILYDNMYKINKEE